MLTDTLTALDTIVRRNHPKLYSSLNKGRKTDPSTPAPLQKWYEWQDGQNRESDNLLFDWYRFYSFQEARQLCLPQTEYSLPLLTDDAGLGYWLSTVSHNVFYNWEECYDTIARLFTSFDTFVDFLIEFADGPPQSIGEFFEREERLLQKYTRYL